MKTIETKFSKYELKRRFGKEYISYAKSDRIYKIKGIYVMFGKINENQFGIHPAYVDSFMRVVEKENKNKK